MITNKTEYLLLILTDLAQHLDEGYVLSRDVARRQDIPAKYVPQLMAVLTRRGWVSSLRGAGGGVRLAVDPSGLTVRDVMELAGDASGVKACVAEHTCPKQDACPLRPLWIRAQSSLDAIMGSVTIRDLAERRPADQGPSQKDR